MSLTENESSIIGGGLFTRSSFAMDGPNREPPNLFCYVENIDVHAMENVLLPHLSNEACSILAVPVSFDENIVQKAFRGDHLDAATFDTLIDLIPKALILAPRRGLWLDTGCLGVAWTPILELQDARPGVELDAEALALSALGVLEG
ncbi:hypothetical protein PIB30_060500 [Stylosanthes scabra]|uniref:Uncharacterized protein n=1 Tax=Stylosanthes scabra TaxID=79078 RepID=A0ABU6XKD3_9FABA|nr:hypothetical protein [Stylosanthes scabra]